MYSYHCRECNGMIATQHIKQFGRLEMDTQLEIVIKRQDPCKVKHYLINGKPHLNLP